MVLSIEIGGRPIPALPPDPLPNILYQLLTTAPPSPFPDILPMSDRDAADGYVHLARAFNILPLAMKNYNYTLQIWVLKLNYKWMREKNFDIRWEWSKSNTTFYPHLYGNTTKQMFIDMKTWTRKQDEKWNQTSLAGDTWLTDGNASRASNLSVRKIEWILLPLFFTTVSFHFISL